MKDSHYTKWVAMKDSLQLGHSCGFQYTKWVAMKDSHYTKWVAMKDKVAMKDSHEK